MSKAGAIKKKLLGRPKGIQLKNQLGAQNGDKIAQYLVDNSLAAGIGANWSDDQLIGAGETLMDIEIDNAISAGLVLGKLASKLTGGQLAPLIGANTLAEAQYGATAADADSRKAATWVCHASNTLQPAAVGSVENVINEAVRVTTVTSLEGILSVNAALLHGAQVPAGRAIVPGSPLPSSIAGRRLLQVAAQYIEGANPGVGVAWTDLACYLLGTVIRTHGFVDANGRSGRALYAVALLKGGAPFTAITVAGERALHGLP